MNAYVHSPNEPIAIIGSGCRFPGDATSPSKLWQLVSQPKDVSKRVPERSFNPEGFYHPNGEHHGASNVTKSYFIEEDPRLFDSVFFNISPREAEAIDPQQRLLLETVYEAMESSGLTLKQLQGSLTSAYVGIMTNDYTDTHARDPEFFSQYQATGTSRALSSNRLSYFFDWKGPSMTVDTACSSSLAAIHLALQSLRSGESEIACAAGANLLLGPDLFIGATSLHMISPSGKSQMWDAGADGYARGEGVAAVFLKTLSHALRDGDRIDALIRETGVNSDGRTKGITLPSPEAQATLIRRTYQRAGLDLLRKDHRPQYFEAHGTGTQAGDPREASAIKAAFFPEYQKGEKLLVGSIKTVIGHTEGCAGIAGVLKAMLAMQNQTVPPNQHLKLLNPKVEDSYANLEIPKQPTPWPKVETGHPLRASVNSFGFGGTNSHAILESYVPEIHNSGPWGLARVGLPDRKPPLLSATLDFTPVPLVMSANSEKALAQLVSSYASLLQSSRSSSLDVLSLAWTLQKHRSLLPHQISFSGTNSKEILQDMQKKLAQVDQAPDKPIGQRASGKRFSSENPARILGVFTGQGAQWPQMGRHLILHSTSFRKDIQSLEESLRALSDGPSWSLEAELMADPTKSRLSEAALSQPLCTAVQVALCNLLESAGIRFHTVVGHSSGEIAAAYAAGRISASDAVRIAYYRGVHAKLAVGASGQKGSMIAAGFGIDEAKEFCDSTELKGRLTVAASNSPGGVTLSGDEDAVKEAKILLDERGLFNRVLQVDTAYHSHHMGPCADIYVQSLMECGIEVKPSKIAKSCTWVSSVYGSSRVPSDQELKATYWRDNMVQTVLFSQAVDEALDLLEPFDFAIEVGPHPTLRGPALQSIKAKLGRDVPYVGVLDRKKNDVTAFSDFLGSVWMSLGPDIIDLNGYTAAFFPDFVAPPPLDDLPTYRWQHETILWRESRLNKQYRLRTARPHELLGVRTSDDTPHEMRWRNLLKLDELSWLSEHRIQGQIIVPGAAYCIMAFEAAKVLAASHGLEEGAVAIEIRDLSIEKPIALDDGSEATETLFSLREVDAVSTASGKTFGVSEHLGTADFVLSAGLVEDGVMRRVCRGSIAMVPVPTPKPTYQQYVPRQDMRPMSVERFYRSLGTVGLDYSGPFQGLIYAERALDTASGVIARHDIAAGLPVHPSWLDVSFQSLFAALSAPGDESMWTAFVPSSIRKVRFAPRAGVIEDGASPSYYVDAFLTGSRPPSGGSLATITGDISIFNGTSGSMEIQIEDVTMTALLPSVAKDDRQMYMQTVWQRDINDGVHVQPGVKSDMESFTALQQDSLHYACQAVVHDYLARLEVSASMGRVKNEQFGRGEISRLVASIDSNLHVDLSSRDIAALKTKFAMSTEIQLITTIGDVLVRKFQGHASGRVPAKAVQALWSDYLGGLATSQEQIESTKNILQQISHKYPTLRVLQTGLTANVDPLDIIQHIQRGFASYTILTQGGNNMPESTSQKLETLALEDRRIEIVEASSEKDIAESLAGKSFHVILHGYERFQPTSTASFAECRALLVPGGYLITSAPNQDDALHTFVAHGLELLESSSRVLTGSGDGLLKSLQSQLELDRALIQTGFSGIEALIPGVTAQGTCNSHGKATINKSFTIVSKATDTIVEILHSPLDNNATSQFFTPGFKVVVIGGMSLETAKLSSKIRASLGTLGIDVVLTQSLEALDAGLVSSNGGINAVICLTDLDAPLLRKIDEAQLLKLQTMADNVKTILWITRGAFDGGSPEQSATVGLWRSVTSENAHLTFQLIDFEKESYINDRTIVEAFLRAEISGSLGPSDKTTRLWSHETEVAVVGGNVMIPRIIADVERNGRHNSRRRVVESTRASRSDVAPRVRCPSSHGTALDILYSSETAIVAVGSDKVRLQLVLGTNNEDDQIIAAALVPAEVLKQSQDRGSIASTAFQKILEVNLDELGLFASSMLLKLRAVALVSQLPNRKTSVILGATQQLINAVCHTLGAQQSRTKKTVVFLTTDTALVIPATDQTEQDAPRIVVVHPESSTRLVRTHLPWQTECVFDVSSEVESQQDFALSKCINWWCEKITFTTNGKSASVLLCPQADGSALDVLVAEAIQYAKARIGATGEVDRRDVQRSSSGSFPELSPRFGGQLLHGIVDWRKTVNAIEHSSAAALAKPLSAQGLFFADKTYLLFGLTGQIGRSITEYMIRNGARHIILASRRPPGVDPMWEASLLHTFGARIRFEAVDITSRSALEALRGKILLPSSSSYGETMPPSIGGIANGAMILADGLFSSMTLESLQRVLRPKVIGSMNLDAVFGKDELDFFLMFSSLSAVIGMPAQSNYAAANMFMVGLAAQRRSRKLAASVVDLGMIIGLGYISRAEGDEGSGAVEASLRRQNYMAVGERDLHEVLTESIVAGKPSQLDQDHHSIASTEIITGLAPYRKGASNDAPPPVWVHEPRFSHLVIHAAGGEGASAGGIEGKQTLKGELAGAPDVEQVVEIVQRYFVAYLAATLKLSESQMGVNVPIIDFGIDSLVAVEIRSWFSLETGQDVPVLKILGGATVQQLCTTVAAQIPLGSTATPVLAETEVSKLAIPAAKIEEPTARVVFAELVEARALPVQSAPTPGGRSAMSYVGSTTTSTRSGTDTPLSSAHSASDDHEVKPEEQGDDMESVVARSGPLSLGQSRFYLPSLYLEDKSPFNCTTSYQITGSVHIDRLVESLKQVVERHEILRTIFSMDNTTGQGVQSVLNKNSIFVPLVLELSTTSETEQIEAEFSKMHGHVFDLAAGDTLRATILTSPSGNKHIIIFGYHHIVMDGVSWQSFLTDLAECYKSSNLRTATEAIPTVTQYLDFAAKQAANLTPAPSAAFQERIDFWKAEFPNGVPPPIPLLPLAKTRTRKLVTEYKTRVAVTHVDAHIVARIRKVAQALRVTSFHFWLGVFQAMFARLLQQGEHDEAVSRDLCIGIVDANRSDQTFAKTIGYLLEVLPVRFNIDMAQKFSNLLQHVRTKAYSALAHSGIPIEEILRACSTGSSTAEAGATPFFQIVFNYRMGATKAPSLINDHASSAKMDLLDYADATTPFDLSVSLDEKDDGSAMVTFAMLDYLYDSAATDALVATYKHMLDVLSQQPSTLVGDVPLYSAAMAQEAISVGTGVSLTKTEETTVSRRITRWVSKDPHAIAVKDGSGVSRTYLEISKRADVIAAALERSAGSGGIGPGSLVCVLTEPCADTVSCILAILRLGAAYVPLDVRNADERLADVLDESGAQLVVFHTATRDRATQLPRTRQSVRYLNLSILDDNEAPIKLSPSVDRSRPEDTAFVLYTSGSTGKPKGIALTNNNMAVQNASVTSHLNIGREVVLQQSGLGFDASLCQIFMCLCNGGTLVTGDNKNQDPAELAALVEGEGITFTICMMSEMAAMLRHGGSTLKRCKRWRLAMCAGEAFSLQLARDFAALDLPDLQVVNAYGPTEGTIMATIEPVAYREMAASKDDRVLIGQVIPEYGVYIIDSEGNPLPRGFAGEIALAGPGVASGYLHNPQLTASKFVPDNISSKVATRVGWTHVYRTGDKGRLVENNKFIHLGRMEGDSQVKLRGIRIELQDIKHSILATSVGVLSDAAIVLKGEMQSNQYLAAFVVFANDEFGGDDKQAYLRDLLRQLPLPAYMRPAIAVPVAGSLPVTGRGKLDTKLLAAMPLGDHDLRARGEEENLTETERRLREVWQQVLADAGVAKELTLSIKKDSDFFSVGGNSLLLMQLRVQIRNVFDGVDIPLVQLFQSSNLSALAAKIAGPVTTESAGSLSSASDKRIDWEHETSLDNDISAILKAASVQTHENEGVAQKAQGPRSFGVLLTGATGFLGSALLEKLASDRRVSVIHCVAVRGDASRLASTTSSKVVAHKGDLSQPLLGMTPDEAAAVMADTTVVIHNGATVSHLKNYHSLKAANLGSTKELTRLVLRACYSSSTTTTTAPRKKIPIHYISTGGIARLSGLPQQPESSLAMFPPPVDGSDGYVATKWASERYLERLHEETAAASAVSHAPSGSGSDLGSKGWPVTIHRPSSITSFADPSRVPATDITHNVLRYSRLLGRVPDFSKARGFFDFVDVETIAGNIVNGAYDSYTAANNEDGDYRVTYCHQSGDVVVPADGLAGYLAKEEKEEYEVVDMATWVHLAVDAGMDPLVGSFLTATGGKLDMPLLVRSDK